MPGLLTKDGKPIWRDGGLTYGEPTPYCCCEEPPPPCPECCVKITWGTFNDNGDLVVNYGSLSDVLTTIIIEMPTKNSRVVCWGEEITVEVSIDGDNANSAEWDPRIIWDHLWIYQDHSPSIGSSGYFDEHGIVDWGYIGVGPASVQVVFTLNACHVDNVQQLGDIEITLQDPSIVELISVESCPIGIDTDCCEVDPTCCPCGFLIPIDNEDPDKWEPEGTCVVKFIRGEKYAMRVEICTEEPGLICQGDTVTVKFKLIPYTAALAVDVIANAKFEFAGFKYVNHTPAIDPLTGVESVQMYDDCIAAPLPGVDCCSGTIQWGDLAGQMEFEVVLEVDVCDCPPPSLIDIVMQPEQDDVIHETLAVNVIPEPCPENSCPTNNCVVHWAKLATNGVPETAFECLGNIVYVGSEGGFDYYENCCCCCGENNCEGTTTDCMGGEDGPWTPGSAPFVDEINREGFATCGGECTVGSGGCECADQVCAVNQVDHCDDDSFGESYTLCTNFSINPPNTNLGPKTAYYRGMIDCEGTGCCPPGCSAIYFYDYCDCFAPDDPCVTGDCSSAGAVAANYPLCTLDTTGASTFELDCDIACGKPACGSCIPGE
jgi:hypothetical protein